MQIAGCPEVPAEPESNISPLMAGAISPAILVGVNRLDCALQQAIREAKQAGVLQGLIVSLLHAHALNQTRELL